VQDRTRISPLCNVVVDLFLANKTLDGSFRRLSLDIVFADLCNGFQKLEREPKTKDDKTPRSQELTQLCTRIVDFGNAIMKTHPVLVWEYFFYGLPVYLAATKTLTKRDVPMAITKALDELLERSEPAILVRYKKVVNRVCAHHSLCATRTYSLPYLTTCSTN
jgi:hypothetical protein